MTKKKDKYICTVILVVGGLGLVAKYIIPILGVIITLFIISRIKSEVK